MSVFISYNENKEKILTKFLLKDDKIEIYNEALNGLKKNGDDRILFRLFDYPGVYLFYPDIFYPLCFNHKFVYENYYKLQMITRFVKTDFSYEIYTDLYNDKDKYTIPLINFINDIDAKILKIQFFDNSRFMEIPIEKAINLKNLLEKCYIKFNS